MTINKVLLTGATGFIGRHCLPLLADCGYEVHAVYTGEPVDGPSSVRWHKADLLNPQNVDGLMGEVRPSHLLHFAWYVSPSDYRTSAENLRWVQASLSLVEGFARYGGNRVVMAGTCMEYDWRYGYCVEGLTPLSPSTLYGTAKHSLQLIVSAFAEQEGLSAAWGRIFFLYGPHEHQHRLVPSVIRSVTSGERARCSHGKQIRDFLCVADVADAFVALLGSEARGPVNIASGRPVAIKDVIQKIGEITGRQDLIELGAIAAREDDPPMIVADVSRLTEELGWSPKYDLDTGLRMTIDWWRNQSVEGERESIERKAV